MSAADSLNITPSLDRRSVRLTFTAFDEAVELDLSAEELDAVIRGLATARAALSPPVPMSHSKAPMHPAVVIQAVVPAQRIADKRLILLRHPGFGWMSFELTGNAGADLAAGILSVTHADRNTPRNR